jgi:hypothetical protein
VHLLGTFDRGLRAAGAIEVGVAGLPGWYVPAVCKAAGVLLAHHSVHEPVDDLCKKAASLWAWREMLGIAAASRARGRAVTWEKTFTPCAQREKWRCPHNTPQWWINRLNVYRKLIWLLCRLRDRETWNSRDR